MPRRILVVEDEENIAYVLEKALRGAGHLVASVDNGTGALDAAQRTRPDLILLDVMLPGMNGFSIAENLRDAGQETPIIFLTARGALEDRVEGLRNGDDYITKPFEIEELLARVAAVLRRSAPADVPALVVADLTLDPVSRQVTRGGRTIELAPTEYRLLQLLMRHNGRLLQRAFIMETIWGDDVAEDSTVLDTYVSSLRKKIDDRDGQLLVTVRGSGYRLGERT